MSRAPQRGPLASILLASTSEDIRKCGHCEPCCFVTHPAMDLTPGELLQMAARDDPAVFTSQTLWNCDLVISEDGHCQEGINLSQVIEVLRNEAILRGYSESRGTTPHE